MNASLLGQVYVNSCTRSVQINLLNFEKMGEKMDEFMSQHKHAYRCYIVYNNVASKPHAYHSMLLAANTARELISSTDQEPLLSTGRLVIDL